MSFQYTVYNTKNQLHRTQRVSLVSFQRAIEGLPELNYPDIDDRGYFRPAMFAGAGEVPNLGFDRGPVVGVTEGDTVFIEMKRERIDDKASLFVLSSNDKVMNVTAEDGKHNIPNSKTVKLKITGIKGGSGVMPNRSEIEIRMRYGAYAEAIIGAMSVWVFKKLEVLLTLHIATIQDSSGNSLTANITDTNTLIRRVKAVWQPCGISFTVNVNPVNPVYTFIKAGQVILLDKVNSNKDSEVDQLFKGEHHSDKSINAYFVNKILKPIVDNDPLGFTIDSKEGKNFSINPGIVIQTDSGGILSMTLAHEIGHFLGLSHPDYKESSKGRKDIWAKRMIMAQSSVFGGSIRNIDVGYGKKVRGALITMKDLKDSKNQRNHSTDPEWIRARESANSSELYKK